jgi:hypothetical protein
MSSTSFSDTVFQMDSFFVQCEQNKQGISTSESSRFRIAVEEMIKLDGIGVVLDLNDSVRSDCGQRLLRVAMDNVHPNFSKLFTIG